MRKKTRK